MRRDGRARRGLCADRPERRGGAVALPGLPALPHRAADARGRLCRRRATLPRLGGGARPGIRAPRPLAWTPDARHFPSGPSARAALDRAERPHGRRARRAGEVDARPVGRRGRRWQGLRPRRAGHEERLMPVPRGASATQGGRLRADALRPRAARARRGGGRPARHEALPAERARARNEPGARARRGPCESG